MLRKIALIIATTTVAVPVGTAIMSNAAGAATRTRPASVVEHQHKEKTEATSKDRSPENSRKDKKRDIRDSKDTTKDPSKGSPSPDRTPSVGHSLR
jgi:hypothetical protein